MRGTRGKRKKAQKGEGEKEKEIVREAEELL